MSNLHDAAQAVIDDATAALKRARLMLDERDARIADLLQYNATRTDELAGAARRIAELEAEVNMCICAKPVAPAVPAPSDDFNLRGMLAESLTYWHRLTELEAAELVALAYRWGAKPAPQAKLGAQQEPVGWNDWKMALAAKVDNYIQLQSEDDDDETLTAAYNDLKEHILSPPQSATAQPIAPALPLPLDGAIEIDWAFETADPLLELDAIYAEYSKTFGRTPDAAMAETMQKVKLMLFLWWGWHRDAIRSAFARRDSCEEPAQPAPQAKPAEPAVTWDAFIARLNAINPLGTVKVPLPHKNFHGSISKYRQIFIDAQAAQSAPQASDARECRLLTKTEIKECYAEHSLLLQPDLLARKFAAVNGLTIKANP